ncbi:hypothetical protein ACFO3O_11965 [Dokdonia ponticola]|uniref:DUF4136 domain-containing protein n=1 Tax=Dokdonia ponticola TaxID=2041041 RepID=A0ABV9HYR8_9FLAO
MKNIILLLGIIMLSGCSSIRVVDSWKNEDVLFFKPQKLLVVGVTNNLTARKIFESRLKEEFQKRNINAFESSEIIDVSFTDSKKTEEEINTMIQGLSEKGFDAIIISAVKGVDDKRNYSRGYYTIDYRWRRFGRYYYYYQDIYYNPDYYNEYKIYHVETSIYNINENDDKSLIWVGALDLVDPQGIYKTVDDYVVVIINRLEEEGLITRH